MHAFIHFVFSCQHTCEDTYACSACARALGPSWRAGSAFIEMEHRKTFLAFQTHALSQSSLEHRKTLQAIVDPSEAVEQPIPIRQDPVRKLTKPSTTRDLFAQIPSKGRGAEKEQDAPGRTPGGPSAGSVRPLVPQHLGTVPVTF